jgi:beta-phosphoglucomutase-like phosphatase (HAD superfamily)
MVDAVLLEWEGVLADTGLARRDSMLRALADEGVPFDATAYDACCGGLDVHAAASAAVARSGRADAVLVDLVALRAGRDFMERLAQGVSLQRDAARFVAAVQHRSRIAIVTRATRAETDLVLGMSGLASAVACIVTADDVLTPPPAPAAYEQALRHLSRMRLVRPDRAIALVDGSAGARAARAAGIRALVVGAPAHVAMDGDATVDDLTGLMVDAMAALVGVATVEHPA